jgi:hypothetical protein
MFINISREDLRSGRNPGRRGGGTVSNDPPFHRRFAPAWT